MTRDPFVHHDPAVLTPDVGAALIVHRSVPAVSLSELCELAARPGPTRRAVEHVRACPACVVWTSCRVGERLAAKISRPRRRRRPA